MDSRSKDAIVMLEAVAASNAQFIKHAFKLRSHPEVTRVHHDLDCRQYEPNSLVQIYVEAELRNTNAVVWWLDLRWDEDQWTIDARILLTHDLGQDTIRDFPEKSARTLDTCIHGLLNATSDLIGSIDPIDAALQWSPDK